jgi:hypothetical protein
VGADFEERLFDAGTPEALSVKTWGPIEADERRRESRREAWSQHHVGVYRYWETPASHRYRAHEETVAMTRDGTVAISRGYVLSTPDMRRVGALYDNELRGYFEKALKAGRDILADYGAHGDLRLLYELDLGERGLHFESIANVAASTFAEAIIVEVDTTFDDDTVAARVFGEIRRAAGFGPER